MTLETFLRFPSFRLSFPREKPNGLRESSGLDGKDVAIICLGIALIVSVFGLVMVSLFSGQH